MNGLADLAPISKLGARKYEAAVGQYRDVVLRFSASVARALPPTLKDVRKLLAAMFAPLVFSDPEAVDRELCLQRGRDDPDGWEIRIAATEEDGWKRGDVSHPRSPPQFDRLGGAQMG